MYRNPSFINSVSDLFCEYKITHVQCMFDLEKTLAFLLQSLGTNTKFVDPSLMSIVFI